MTTQLLWYVLAGFLLGFTASTLWEWFHFRKERMKLRDRRVTELEAKLREQEELATKRQFEAEEEWPAPAYRSPGVFLETEDAGAAARTAAVASAQAGALPPASPAPQPRAPAAPVEPVRTDAEPSRARRDLPPSISVRRIALRGEGQPPREEAPAIPAAAPIEDDIPEWAKHPELTQRSADHPDDLSKVKGIGEVYKIRLYRAGIFTWHQVATADQETLRSATNAYPSSNVHEWPAQARQLAEKFGRTGAVYSGPQPDDLTKIIGIGPVGAQSLYRAGICTYEQLAVTPIPELVKLFPIAVAGDQPDFDRWIAQAVKHANAKHGR
jgi:predicted flap endonuclease-1-like 5' DNA nuclease